MKIKTSELTGAALDWAVARANGYDESWLFRQLSNPNPETRAIPKYSTDWSEGGPIIERERIRLDNPWDDQWEASHPGNRHAAKIDGRTGWEVGPTPLISAMRCYVASKLGEEVDVPYELKEAS